MPKLFTRTVEDFTCEHCGQAVVGDGFTNHCPKCLWSKHVDVNPGDRAGECGGLMEPISFEKRGEKYFILHKCLSCGFEKKNSFGGDDNFEVLLAISKKI